ncbi:IclR family transcriptional regulator [Pelosinus propionicus]|uniref:DNA-binding transcriptional regulator, IclR family n=1 Tax=Pelosinus propionicus DSM 13327 TaxID=1123291 RepID=A0A1I4IZ48_9FIRM|nr:IclR family transcriptional regulator [Pelosinus propionicus]SFL59678.1 DNA-binding transcriptional regulator, IclR family [Pelosinus propionicus DSM 13327]
MSHKPTERVLNILNLLSINVEGLTLTEISKAISVPKSTLYPILQTMTNMNYIQLDTGSLRYKLGISTFCIGSSYSQDEYMLEFTKSIMKNIVAEIKEICQMGVLEGNNVLYVLKEEPEVGLDIRIISRVGKRIPAYCTALGKALLSNYDIEEVKKLYPKGLIPYTENTITDFDILNNELLTIRKEHIAKEHEEITKGLWCYAVPLESNGTIIAALSVSIPNFRATKEKLNLITELLLDARRQFGNVNFK